MNTRFFGQHSPYFVLVSPLGEEGPLSRFHQTLLVASNNLLKREVQPPRDHVHLNEIKLRFPNFIAAHIGLVFVKAYTEFVLRQLSRHPRLSKDNTQRRTLMGKRHLSHIPIVCFGTSHSNIAYLCYSYFSVTPWP